MERDEQADQAAPDRPGDLHPLLHLRDDLPDRGDRARRRQRRRDAAKCNFCMDCIPVCPTGSIDEWRVVTEPYSLEEQIRLGRAARAGGDRGRRATTAASRRWTTRWPRCWPRPIPAPAARRKAPATASKPSVNLYKLGKPAEATVQGNYRLTATDSDGDVRHIILDFGGQPFPVLEGQSIGIIPPGRRTRRQAAPAAALFRLQPARRRAAELQQRLAHREARGARASARTTSAT